tara:strand:- start:283 stop:897 length:615 start_codon:yes stop_codon:yes gene_type:complete
MVSIKSLITLGLIGGGILAFYRLGGASGIGSRIGGGFGSLFDGFTGGLNPVKDVLNIIPNTDPNAPTGQGGQNYDNSGGNGGGSQQIPLEEFPTTDNQGNPLIPTTPITDIAKGFQTPLQQGIISKGFAEKYSFQPPPTRNNRFGEALNVSKTFEYINSPTYRSAVSVSNTSSQFGGYTSADDQRNELQRQIEINATKYPEWFA